MQQVQDCLEFPIDTPRDDELRRQFREEFNLEEVVAYTPPKKRNRKSNKQKRLERIERDS